MPGYPKLVGAGCDNGGEKQVNYDKTTTGHHKAGLLLMTTGGSHVPTERRERIPTTLSTSDLSLSLMCQEPDRPWLTNELWRQNTDVWSDGQMPGAHWTAQTRPRQTPGWILPSSKQVTIIIIVRMCAGIKGVSVTAIISIKRESFSLQNIV